MWGLVDENGTGLQLTYDLSRSIRSGEVKMAVIRLNEQRL